MRHRHRLLPLVLVFLFPLADVVAKPAKNVFRFGLFHAEPTGVSTYPIHEEFGPPDFPFGVIVLDYRERLEAGSALGLEVEYERRFGTRLGLALSLSQAEHEFHGSYVGGGSYMPDFGFPESGTVTGSLRGDVRVTPLMAGLNFHFVTARGSDVYFGPFVAYVDYGDARVRDGAIKAEFMTGYILMTLIPEAVEVENDTGLGANLGVDVPFGRGRWSFCAGLRYLRTELRFDIPGGRSIDLTPWSARLGFGRRF